MPSLSLEFFKVNPEFKIHVKTMKELIPSYNKLIRQMYQEENLSLSELEDKPFTEIINLPFDNMNTEKDVLNRKGYEIIKKVGKGGYGTVYKIKYLYLDQMYLAMKVISLSSRNRNRMIKHLKKEIYIMERCPHPNIITIMDHFIIKDNAFIIMEFADGGTLRNFVYKQGSLSEKISHAYFVQIIKGLFYLHSCKIAHR